MVEYKYNHESNILEVMTSGVLVINDIIDHYHQISKKDSLPKNLKIRIDCRASVFKINTNDIPSSIDAVNIALKKYSTIREAILVDRPFETVVAIMFERMSERFIDAYRFRVFSTEKASLDWLT